MEETGGAGAPGRPAGRLSRLAVDLLHQRARRGGAGFWDGAEQRRQLLATAGIDLTGLDVGDDSVAVDDVLDAAVAAWTGRRVLTGEATSIPDPPDRFSDGLPAAISV